jgi:hypothetical protein
VIAAGRVLLPASGALALLAGAIAARILLAATGAETAGAPTSFALHQPLPTVTAWPAPLGPALLAIWCLAIALAVVPYCRAAFGRRVPEPHAAVLAATALALAAAAWPVVFSSDALAYAAYGREALLGLSPYGRAPLDPSDPVFAAAIAQWGNPPPICAYGPAFVAFAAGAARLAGRDPLALVALLRGLAIAAFVGAAWLAGRLAGPRAALALGANPVVAWGAAEGHNDALALAWVLVGLLALRRTPAAVACIALGALVKAPALLAALGAVVAGADGRTRRARLGYAAIGLAGSVAGALPLLLALLAHRGDAHVGGGAAFGLPAAAGSIGGPIAEASAILAILGIGAAVGGRRLAEGRRCGYAVCGLALWYALPNVYPWYGTWLVALVPVAETMRVRAAIVAATIVAAIRYLPDALAHPPPALVTTLLLALPLVVAVAPRPRPLPESP